MANIFDDLENQDGLVVDEKEEPSINEPPVELTLPPSEGIISIVNF